MSDAPELPTSPGISWRAPTLDDTPGLAAHTRLIHEAEHLSFLPNTEFFEWLFTQPGIDIAEDARVGLLDGEIVADGGTWLHTGERGSRCIVWAETTPGHESLRDGLLEWATQRARARLVGTETPQMIRSSVEEHRTAMRSVYERAGFSAVRAFVDMARPLTDLPTASDLPPGVDVIPWSVDWSESARIASNASFVDHWGTLPMDEEEWAGFTHQGPTFRADLSFLAIEDDRVVSFCLAEVDEDDNAERDTDDLYIQRVGTIPECRGRGIASHLIVKSMEAAVETGSLDRAALDVDEMSHTNATRVYERLGFEPYARSITYVIETES